MREKLREREQRNQWEKKERKSNVISKRVNERKREEMS